MKRRISDMLGNYGEQELDIQQVTPLSSKRIKELTMSRIEQKDKKRRSVRGTLSKVIVAAAVISALTLTAAAAEYVFGAGDWFRGIFNAQLKEDRAAVEKYGLDMSVQETVGQNQIDLINEIGEVFEEKTYTDQGTTVTMTAAYADANVMHMYIQVEAPEGTVLPDDILYQFYDPNEFGVYEPYHWGPLELEEGAPYEVSGFQFENEALPDADPTDNKKDFHITLYKQPGTDMKLNDGVKKWWHIGGIYQQVVDMNEDEDGYVLLAPGEFVVDISLAKEVRVIDFDVSDMTYGGHKVRQFSHPEGVGHFADCPPYDENGVHTQQWDYTVTPTKFQLSPLGVEWACDFICSDEQICPGLSYKIMMKDGTNPVGYDQGGNIGDASSSGTIIYDTPIDLDQIDYILIGDEELGQTYKLTVPE